MRSMSLDALPHLETFAEAAERGSFTAAARQLGLTSEADAPLRALVETFDTRPPPKVDRAG